MMIIKVRNFAILHCFFMVLGLKAQGPPITTETPIMLGLAGSGVRTFGRFVKKEQSNTYVHILGAPVNVSPTFQVGGVVPLVFKTPDGGETMSGLGDMTLFVKYQLYKKDKTAKTFRVLARVAQTFPTGKSEIGSEAYQTYMGIIVGFITSGLGIYTDVGYTLIGKDQPDNIRYNVSIGYPLLPQRYPQRQLNVYLEWNGTYLPEPGNNLLFLSPGIQFIPGRRLLIESSFQFPVIQAEENLDKTRFQVLAGIRFLIS